MAKTWLDYVIDDSTAEYRDKLRAITPTDSLRWRWLLTIQQANYVRVAGLEIDEPLKKQALEEIRQVAEVLANAVCTGVFDSASAASAAWSDARSAASAASAARSAASSASADSLVSLSRENPPTCDGDDYRQWQTTLADAKPNDFRWMIYADWLDERGHGTVANWYRMIHTHTHHHDDREQ